jgi:type I restriction enzyme S subunit
MTSVEISWSFGTQQNIGMNVIENLPLVVPPLKEQEAICKFLSRKTKIIDELIEKKERQIELLNEKRQALISHAVTKGTAINPVMKKTMCDFLPMIPETWSIVRLKMIAFVQSGVTKGRDLKDIETIEVPYLRVANVQDGFLNLTDIATILIGQNELKRYELRKGDVLMNEGGDNDKLGRGCVWHGEIKPCVHQNHVFAVRPTNVEPEWLNLITSSSYAKAFFQSRAKQSTNLASISSTNLKELPITLPPKAERRSIIEHVRGTLCEIDSLIEMLKMQVDKIQEYRSAIISAAVTGNAAIEER